MISVGLSRNEAGTPVMREKAFPSSEQLFFEDAPSIVEQDRIDGRIVFRDGVGLDEPQRRYSHSSADIS